MTISANYSPTNVSGNGATTVFTGTWPIFVASYLVLEWVDKTTGVRTTKVMGSDYTLTFNNSGWVATFQAGSIPPSTVNVVGSRNVPLTQGLKYSTSSGFNGTDTEQSFDLLTAMLQDNEDALGRALIVPAGDGAINALPSAAARANAFLAFDLSGEPIAATGPASDVIISAAMTPVVQASTTAIALSLLGATGRLLNIQRITSNGNYTPTIGTKLARVRVVGGGSSGSRGGSAVPVCGGPSGGYAEKLISNPVLTACTIGAGGTVITVDSTAGNAGGTTSFGTLCIATGGSVPPMGSNTQATAGIGTVGDLLIAGNEGYALAGGTANTGISVGGASPYLGSSSVLCGTDVVGISGKNPGDGGSGSSSGRNSGTGHDGIIIVEEYS